MATHAITIVYDRDGDPICNMYCHFDGYPSGYGFELARFLKTIDTVTNGIRVGETRKIANTMGCLAAQMVSHFKGDTPGLFYLYKIKNDTNYGQDYEYHVYFTHEEELRVQIREGCSLAFDIPERKFPQGNVAVVFDGNVSDFYDFCNEYDL